MIRRILIFLSVALLLPGVASAQAGIDAVMNKIIQGTPGITNIVINGGVRAGATGSVGVAAGGYVIPVATAASADISAGAIALGAARVGLRVVPWVGAALTVAEIARQVNKAGIVTCPPPDFFCKPDPTQNKDPTVVGGWGDGSSSAGTKYSSPGAFCSAWAAGPGASLFPQNHPYCSFSLGPVRQVSANDAWCTRTVAPIAPGCSVSTSTTSDVTETMSSSTATCPDGYTMTSNKCVPAQVSLVPAATSDLQSQLNANFAANAQLALAMKQNIDTIQQASPGAPSIIDYTTIPAVVSAPPVTSDPKLVSTNTISNPDGTTSTQKIVQQTTVTPSISAPSTVTAPNVTFPSTTTTTTTTTNNSTNVVTTNVTNVNNPPPVTTPDALKIPTDYNREATQLSILQKITEFNAPITATAPDGQKDLDTVQAKIVQGTTAVDGISQASTGLQGWFPTIATSTCRNPVVPNAIGGGTTAVPICDSVNIFSQFISAVICVFALFGCVREVQSALKA